MIRLLIPIIFIGTAIGLFVVYTNPTYQTIKGLQVQNNSYDEALTKAQKLRSLRDELLQKRNTITSSDLQKLSHVLPDNVDNIRLIIDVNHIAAQHNLILTNVDLGDLGQGQKSKPDAGGAGDGNQIGSVVIGFSITSDYDSLLSFLHDLEHSQRLLDIQKFSLTTSPTGQILLTLSVRTYWLHQ